MCFWSEKAEDICCQVAAISVMIFCHVSVTSLSKDLYARDSSSGPSASLNWSIMPIFHLVMSLVYGYWALASFTNPGYHHSSISVTNDDNINDDDDELPLSSLKPPSTPLPSCSLKTASNNITLLFHDAPFPRDERSVAPTKSSIVNPCFKCHQYKPPRCHHCRICRRCVLRYDHHCPWIGNCVGHGNVAYFNRFLIFTPVALMYALALVTCNYYEWKKREFRLSYQSDDASHAAIVDLPSVWQIIHISITALVLVITTVLVSAMAYYHVISYARQNVTTMDNLKFDSNPKTKQTFPYDLGSSSRNWEIVMGSNYWGVLGLGKSIGNGIDHQVNTFGALLTLDCKESTENQFTATNQRIPETSNLLSTERDEDGELVIRYHSNNN